MANSSEVTDSTTMASMGMASDIQAGPGIPETFHDSSTRSSSLPSGTTSDGSSDCASSSQTSDITHETTPDSGDEKAETILTMPDMFSSIMAVDPVVNPNYFKVKPKGEAWIQGVMDKDEKWGQKNSRVDLCYLASIWAPNADEDALRMMLDWNHWVFLFDDQFDEGHLKFDLASAEAEVEANMAILTDDHQTLDEEENKLRWMFQLCWTRLKNQCGPEMQQRWRDMHRRYFDGLIDQVKQMSNGETSSRSVQEYIEMRRGTIGVYPAIALTQYGLNIEVPSHVFEHPSLQECMRVSADLVLLVNDVLSYKKDLALGVDHNLITLVQEQGGTAQDAIDKIGEMIKDCYRRWYGALANMPVWGEVIDRHVLQFIDGCRNVALGNLYWSFKTGRYLGAEGIAVHETRALHLPAEIPEYTG